MGYAKSPATLRRIEALLKDLAEGRPCVWETQDTNDTGWAGRWAYKVREGLSIAARHPDLFPGLAANADRFTVEELSPFKVQARFSANTVESAVIAAGTAPSVTHGVEDAGAKPRTYAGPQTAMSIIDTWLKSQQPFGHNDPLNFSQAGLTPQDMAKLHAWAVKRTPPWMIVNPKGTPTVILMPHDAELEATGAAWSPTV